MKTAVAWFLGIVVFFGLMFAIGAMDNLYNATIGRQSMNVKRENYERSQSYVHGKMEDLSKYKREYERATNPAEKAQVRSYILGEFANFDRKLIDNPDLYNFLVEMERGAK